MKTTFLKNIFAAAVFAPAAFTLSTLPARAAEDNILNPDAWPRTYKVGETEIAIYMPQILEWTEFRHLKATSAIGVKLEGKTEVAFGAVAIDADTISDFDHGSVQIGKREFTGFRFPELDAAAATKVETLIRSVLTPESPMELPLDAMTAAVDRADATTGDTAVSFEPPPIFYSDSPAVLVTFIGEPKLEAVSKDTPMPMFAVNTNWDVLFNGSEYYLLADNQWLVTKDLIKGPWAAAKSIPNEFKDLPDDSNWSEVKAKLVILPDTEAPPRVFASNRPAEIVLTKGKPQMIPISGTSLMYVANTESDLFYHPAGKSYYLLTAGRWFGSASLEGPWVSAMDTLPEDFAKIPENHPKAHALVSVQGTPEADEAVIMASIPQTATVDRASTTIAVVYEGKPQFKPVPGTEDVQFAINTSEDVFLVSGSYYCCHQGVWFQAPAASGAWIVCDKVPAPIYTIPPESPKYNVTYVQVYNSTPTTVQVGVTSGYSGAYVTRGLVVFGLGMWLGHEMAENNYWHSHYYPSSYWYGYGCGAVYRPGHGYYGGGARYYGPYGGAGYGAAYNPATGIYSRGAYAYGPRGAVGARSAYNPWTNTAAGRVGAKTPYGSWGRSAVVRDDEWVRAGHRSNANGTVGGIQTSNGGAVAGVNRKYGSDAIVGKSAGGDVYVGKDGNIYKKDADSGWQKRENGGWNNAADVPKASPYSGGKSGLQSSTGTRPSQPTTKPADPSRPTTKPATDPSRPSTKPATDPSRPTTKPATDPSRPSTKPVTRPSQPISQPSSSSKRPSYKSSQSNSSQLNRDSYSRSRSSGSSSSSRSRR